MSADPTFDGLRAHLPRPAVLAQRTVGALALAGIGLASTGFALAAAERPSFLAPPTVHGHDPAWLAGPLAGHWPALSHAVGTLRWGATLGLLAMTVLWLLAVACARVLGPVAVAVALAAAVVVLTLAPPYSLGDTFNYLHYARMRPLYGLDPYAALPRQARADPAYVFSTWHHLRDPYGPLFTFALERLAPLGLPASYWALKAAVGAAALACGALVALLARDTGRDPGTVVAFTMLNPLVLIYGVGGVHNDLLVAALLLCAALLVRRRHPAAVVAGGTLLAAGAAIKLSAGLAAPFILLASRRRVLAAIGLGLGAPGAAALVLFAYSGRLPDDGQQSRLVMGLSPGNLLGIALGRGGLDPGLRSDLMLALALGACASALWAWRTRDWAAGAAASFVVLILCLGWVMPCRSSKREPNMPRTSRKTPPENLRICQPPRSVASGGPGSHRRSPPPPPRRARRRGSSRGSRSCCPASTRRTTSWRPSGPRSSRAGAARSSTR